jgi:peptidylprolyl isomerase domain and WD repeat-containing protein 1
MPVASMYEKSYMHQDAVTHINFAPNPGILITGSSDGTVKFWKKQMVGIDFVKHFSLNVGGIDGLSTNSDGQYCATISESDKRLRVFHVPSYDLISMINLTFTPSGILEWCYRTFDTNQIIAVGIKENGDVHLFNLRNAIKFIKTIKIHRAPVTAICFNGRFNTVVSTDLKGLIEYWRPIDGSFPRSEVTFHNKIDSNLYDLSKEMTYSRSIRLSADGLKLVLFSIDKKIRILIFKTGKIRRIYDESLLAIQSNYPTQEGSILILEPIEFERRIALERTISDDNTSYKVPFLNAIFEEKGKVLIYCTFSGIKYVNLDTNKVEKLLGKMECKERFLQTVLLQDTFHKTNKRTSSVSVLHKIKQDPTLFAIAYRKIRFYLFTQREPEALEKNEIGRDEFAEISSTRRIRSKQLHSCKEMSEHAILHTNHGEIWLYLYPIHCPLTVENFVTHSKNGYYNGLIFHRVVKGFMIQTGDPLGNGSGGQSIWGNDFRDEITKSLRNDRAGTISMANTGPNSNGSQFFITTIACPW